MKALRDYFGDYRDPSWDEFEELQKNYQQMEEENGSLEQRIADLKIQIQERQQQILQEEEEERLRQEEEANKKGSKKQAKK